MFAIIELVFHIIWGVCQAIELLYSSCLGLRWLFSPSYRQELREAGKEGEHAYVFLGVFLLLLVILLLLGLGGSGIVSFLRGPAA